MSFEENPHKSEPREVGAYEHIRTEKAAVELKCHRCAVCDGYGCMGMLPGLGGVFEGKNFQLNCEGWQKAREEIFARGEKAALKAVRVDTSCVRCGPVTGAVENIGYAREEDFYYPYLRNAACAGFGLCVGDGCPDQKLRLGAEAVARLQSECAQGELSAQSNAPSTAQAARQEHSALPPRTPVKAAFFLKPYPQERLFERVEQVRPYASHIGIDIDSYNIVTMRNLVHLERKTATQLQTFRERTGLPFVIKGVFTDDDIELVRQVKPDVVYISNHGGRVETRIGSTVDFLSQHANELKKYCGEIWVDGGIRTCADIQTALFLGASQAIIARPLIRATFDGEYSQAVDGIINQIL